MPQLETPVRAKLRGDLTRKFGQRLSMACGVDLVLFKPLYVKLAFMATFFNFSSFESLKIEY